MKAEGARSIFWKLACLAHERLTGQSHTVGCVCWDQRAWQHHGGCLRVLRYGRQDSVSLTQVCKRHSGCPWGATSGHPLGASAQQTEAQAPEEPSLVASLQSGASFSFADEGPEGRGGWQVGPPSSAKLPLDLADRETGPEVTGAGWGDLGRERSLS